MSAPIINPPTPFVCPFPAPFFPGQMVRIRGNANPNGDRFDINFQTRETTYDTDDIAFHISVRLLQGYIARNSFRDGDWEEEEDYGDLPIQPGQHFELLVLCEPTQFKVAINGRHYCDFKHRLAYAKISHFGVEGDVQLNLVAFEGGPSAPNYQQPAYGAPSAPPPYAEAVQMPPMHQAPQMGMPQPYAPNYSYPPM
ncbi:putative galectin [Trypoxylus dichotomus]